ncbi:MAG TPA: GntR family transcriptional regulator [Rhodothermales bacterium]|nr:GntR family transcriptional regulator [Rhodothermales bacterium]
MIVIDRKASRSVRDQIAEQIRYRIASGQIRVGTTLPSTRSLARQLDVSFHTVRKAYEVLEQEELVVSMPGSGYVAVDPAPLGKADRIERGAVLVHDTLQQLVGLGCDENEMISLFHEQLDLLEEVPHVKLIFAGPVLELAELCARQISDTLQRPVEAVALDELGLHRDADFIIAPCDLLRAVLEQNIKSDALAATVYLGPDVLERTARLLPTQTVGIVSNAAETIPVLMTQLRQQSGFEGNILAVSISEGSGKLAEFASQTDLLLYTPACRRRLLSILEDTRAHAMITPVVSRESLEAVRHAVPA